MIGENDPDCRRCFPWHARETWNLSLHAFYRDMIHLRQRFALHGSDSTIGPQGSRSHLQNPPPPSCGRLLATRAWRLGTWWISLHTAAFFALGGSTPPDTWLLLSIGAPSPLQQHFPSAGWDATQVRRLAQSFFLGWPTQHPKTHRRLRTWTRTACSLSWCRPWLRPSTGSNPRIEEARERWGCTRSIRSVAGLCLAPSLTMTYTFPREKSSVALGLVTVAPMQATISQAHRPHPCPTALTWSAGVFALLQSRLRPRSRPLG
jgi:hypothetical protein